MSDGKFRMKDLTGQRFGRLTVVEFTGRYTKSRNTIWLCKCDCGNFTEADSGSLRVGQKISCGCYVKDRMSTLNRTHGGKHDRLYMVWINMRRRCDNPNHKSYHLYGGRGIKVCDEWHDDYNAFKTWAMLNGYDANAEFSKCTIDRINVNGDYEPSNCRWIDAKGQTNNRRSNHLLEFNGETMTLSQWSEKLGVRISLLTNRLMAGWSVERTLTEPSHGNGIKKLVSDGESHFEIVSEKRR